MHSLAALPVVPFSALEGVPPAHDLPTLAARRRYAQALAAALAGERSYEITVRRRKDMPLLLELRALQEDWPMVGTPGVVALMQPAPLPEDPADLFARAVAAVPGEWAAVVQDVLDGLWAGDVPEVPSADVQAWLGEALTRAGLQASREASEAAHAADPVPRLQRFC